MFLDSISKKYRYRYLFSSDFNNLCLALDFLPEDIDEIKQKTYNLDKESDIEKSIALIIYDQILKNKENPKKKTHDTSRYYRRLSDYKGSSQVEFFYQVYIKDKNRWEDIRNKIEVGIDSGKINNDYLFEKECSHELELISKNDVDNALDTIYLHEIQYLINSHNLNEDVGDYIFKDACLEHYANPLYFDSVKKKFEETLEFVETEPAIEVKNWDIITLWLSYLIVDNEKLATFIDEFIDRTDEIYDADESRYLFTFPSYLGLEMVFYVITCGYDRSYKYRFDFSNIFIIKKGLIEDSNSLLVHQNSKLAQHFEDYIEEDFKKCRDINLKKCETKLYDNFEVTTFRNSDDNKTWHIFDVLNKKSEKISDYNQEDLYEIASQKPLSKEFLQLISSLNFDIDFAYWIQNTAEDSDEVLYWINKKILEDMDYSRNILSADELLNKLDGLYTKTILKFKENKWDEIKESLISKISSGEIKSSYDLQFNFSQMLHSSFKINILNAQIEAILDFKELDYSYSEKLAFYLRDFDILVMVFVNILMI